MDRIPHTIHYCWFGKREKPELIKHCISTWKLFFPGWDVIEWNEENYDINKTAYTKEAYEAKKWAFVADYARFDILYQYGGIYLDTDVEFIKKLPKEYLELSGFTGFECTGIVAPGLIFAVKKSFPLLKELLEQYQTDHFYVKKNGIYRTVNLRVTEILESKGLKRNNTLQTIEDLTIFPSEFFCGYDTDIHEPDITRDTICWHHYFASWSQETKKSRIQKVLKRLVGKKRYKHILKIKRKIKQWMNI